MEFKNIFKKGASPISPESLSKVLSTLFTDPDLTPAVICMISDEGTSNNK